MFCIDVQHMCYVYIQKNIKPKIQEIETLYKHKKKPFTDGARWLVYDSFLYFSGYTEDCRVYRNRIRILERQILFSYILCEDLH